MENEQPKVIKLSPEQIDERKIQLRKTQFQLEMSELNIKQLELAIAEEFPMQNARVELNTQRKNVELMKHNVIALTQQIDKGEI